MNKTNSIELIELLYMSSAFEIVKRQHLDIEDIDALLLAWQMLWAASDLYNEEIKKGESELEAMNSVFDMFYKAYKSSVS